MSVDNQMLGTLIEIEKELKKMNSFMERIAEAAERMSTPAQFRINLNAPRDPALVNFMEGSGNGSQNP